MDKFFLLLFFLVFGASDGFSEEKELLVDPAPFVIPPVVENPDDAFKNLPAVKESKKDSKISPDARMDSKIEAEEQKYHPQKFLTKITMNIPYVTVSGDRRAYTTEPAIDVSFLYCMSEKNKQDTQVWLGLRSANFTGSGVQEGVAGRYNFLFLGPTLGFGKGREPAKPDPVDKTSAGASDFFVAKPKKFSMQEGWLFLAGIGLKQVGGLTDRSHGLVDNDFSSNKRPFFKGFGAFVEFNYVQLFFEAFSLHYNVGFQQSKNHNFYWIGFGVGGWY